MYGVPYSIIYVSKSNKGTLMGTVLTFDLGRLEYHTHTLLATYPICFILIVIIENKILYLCAKNISKVLVYIVKDRKVFFYNNDSSSEYNLYTK